MRHIYLIGLSGSGKSSIGRALANRLGLPFFDCDTLIEEASGERISTLFALHGENAFRDYETRVLAKLSEREQSAVIATGGGIVVRPENRRLIAASGVRIFLEVEPTIALERLREQVSTAYTNGVSPEVRPLVAGPNALERLRQLFEERQTFYREAEMRIQTVDLPPEKVVRACVAALVSSGYIKADPSIIRHVRVGKGYDAIVDWGGLGRLPTYLKNLGLPTRLFIISDSRVGELYGPSLVRNLQQAGFEPLFYAVPSGESSKSFEQLQALYGWLLENRAERQEAVIALGGGVVGDLVGFVAATYLRGVPLVQIPTSLLAQVDSSIGGKTGINHPRGKNLIGAFYHPRLVLADPATLLTLPERERTEGWAEVVKYGMILDANLFGQLEETAAELRTFTPPSAALLCRLVARCIALKAEVVEEDEQERGRRTILNYGHTVGHALENVAGYGEWLHGEAVSLGMVVAAQLALRAGLCDNDLVERQNRLLEALGLPIHYQGNVKARDILDATRLDKKVADRRVRWVMPERIGSVTVTPLPDELIQTVVTAFFAEKQRQ